MVPTLKSFLMLVLVTEVGTWLLGLLFIIAHNFASQTNLRLPIHASFALKIKLDLRVGSIPVPSPHWQCVETLMSYVLTQSWQILLQKHGLIAESILTKRSLVIIVLKTLTIFRILLGQMEINIFRSPALKLSRYTST